MTEGGFDDDGIAGGDGIQSVERPTTTEGATIVETALAGGLLVSLVGEGEIHVPDRGQPAAGVRHVLLKPDGSVVVHGRDGTAPEVALEGEGLDVSTVDGALEIVVGDGGADARLRFERIGHVGTAFADPTTHAAGTERRPAEGGEDHEILRERLLSEPDLVEAGFRPLSTERETSAGPVDVFGRDAEGRAVVVEIKGSRAGPAAVGQLDRYVSALGRDLHADAGVRGVLVAPSATDRTRRLLDERGFTFRGLSPDR